MSLSINEIKKQNDYNNKYMESEEQIFEPQKLIRDHILRQVADSEAADWWLSGRFKYFLLLCDTQDHSCSYLYLNPIKKRRSRFGKGPK